MFIMFPYQGRSGECHFHYFEDRAASANYVTEVYVK